MLLRRCFGMKKSNDNDDDSTLNLTVKYVSKLEYLPNELLFIIFEYLYCHDIIYAFNKLNSRFQFLLHSYEYYHLDLGHETMKSKFNLIQQLPLNTQHIKSLMLSNNDHSSIDIAQYLSMYPLELFYSKLQSLSLIDNDNNRLVSLIFLLPNFQQLKYLFISNRNFILKNHEIEKQIRDIILFEIKALKYFIWDVYTPYVFGNAGNSILLTQKSNIEHYEFYSMDFADLEWFNSNTEHIKSINIHKLIFPNIPHQQQSFETLITLKLRNINTQDNIQFLFEHLTCLTELKRLEFQGCFYSTEDYIDGYKWEYFIQTYIPQLRIFKFFFIIQESIMLKTIDELIEPFMTDFWLIEKQWFITCDHRARWNKTYVYTIPCIKNTLTYSELWQQKSTTTIKNALNIRQLTLYSTKTTNMNNPFDDVQSLTIRTIADDITYEQLNTFLNMSLIKHIEFKSVINSKLFFDILIYNSTRISIEICPGDLSEILRRTTYHDRHRIIIELKRIKRLTLVYNKNWTYIPITKRKIRKLSYLFSNIDELIIKGDLGLSELIYLLNHFKHLSFLSVGCGDLTKIGDDNIRQWLINQQRTKLLFINGRNLCFTYGLINFID